MSIFALVVGVSIVGSLIWCLIITGRMVIHRRRYPLPEIKYTKLFRVCTKEHVVFGYWVSVGIYTIFGIWLIANV